jgi:flagellar motor switch protein FliN
MNASDVLQRFGELPFGVELELGTLALSIREIFEMREGTVLQTEHPAGMPFPLFAGGVHLAEAEVVVINDSVSVRVQKMLQPNPAAGAKNGID